MSKEKFTKGPWKVFDNTDDRPGIDSASGKAIVVFGCNTHDDDDYSGVHGETQEQAKANAYLIAAAPGMYEEIKQEAEAIRFELELNDVNMTTSKRAVLRSVLSHKEKLLAKARGERD